VSRRRPKDLLLDDAPPATTSELARWVGKYDRFIRREIEGGTIQKVNRRQPRQHYRIPRAEAIRYLQQMGVL
jgi:hypothetical protein